VVLATFLANCVPIAAAEQACPCCTSNGLQIVGDFTVVKAVSVPAPSTFVVLHAPVLELPASIDLLSRHASSHVSRIAPPGVPLYLLATTLLI